MAKIRRTHSNELKVTIALEAQMGIKTVSEITAVNQYIIGSLRVC